MDAYNFDLGQFRVFTLQKTQFFITNYQNASKIVKNDISGIDQSQNPFEI